MNQLLGSELDSQGVIISECRDKKLKNTQSWSSNIFVKFHHALKKSKSEKSGGNVKEFCDSLQPIIEKLGDDTRLEPSGFLTFIDITPSLENKQKQQKTKPIEEPLAAVIEPH